jgi:hypothetical protein
MTASISSIDVELSLASLYQDIEFAESGVA